MYFEFGFSICYVFRHFVWRTVCHLRVEKPKVSNLGFNSFAITRTEVRIYLKCLDFARYKSAV